MNKEQEVRADKLISNLVTIQTVLVLVIFKVHDCDQGFRSHGTLYRGPNAPAGLVPLIAGVVSAPRSGVPTACTLLT
jgi:hypothetical protein